MGTGARTPQEDLTSEELRLHLEADREAGLPFDEAWERAMLEVELPADWRNPPHGEEPVVEWARRHFLAAWAGRDPLREAGLYCQHEGGCEELLPPGRRLCAYHRSRQREEDLRPAIALT